MGSFWAPSWGPCWAHFGPWSAQVGPKTLFEPSCLRKSDCSRNNTFYKGLGRFFAQDGAPRRPKIAPRWVQGRLGSLFFRLDFSLQFLIVLGSILVPFWPPKGVVLDYAVVRVSAPWRSKTVLESAWFGLFFVLPFGIAFLILLDSTWGRFGRLLGSFCAFRGHF